MNISRQLLRVEASAALAAGSAAAVAPATAETGSTGAGSIQQVTQQPVVPGIATGFDTVTVVDAATGDVTGTRPNTQARIGIVGPGARL